MNLEKRKPKSIYPKTDRTSAVHVKRFEHIMCINTRIFKRTKKQTTNGQNKSSKFVKQVDHNIVYCSLVVADDIRAVRRRSIVVTQATVECYAIMNN